MVDYSGDKYLLATRSFLANTLISRFKGLMFKKNLEENHVIILHPCNSIHMFFMRFPLDIVYTDKYLNVVKTRKNIKPWQIDLGHRKAKYVFEFPAGTIGIEPKKIVIDMD